VLTQVVVIPRDDPTSTIAPPMATDVPILLPVRTATVESSHTAVAVTPTPSTVPLQLAELRLLFWDVGVVYDTERWQAARQASVPALTHRRLYNCSIYEHGPTEPPNIDRTVTLGSVEYQVAELVANGEHLDWYLGARNADGSFPGGMPTLVVRSTSGGRDTCLAEAEIVLATMAQFTSGASGSSASGSATAPGECPGAPPQQVSLGDEAYVCTQSDHVVLRTKPHRSADMLRYLASGTTMTIIGGPACANSWSWWNVRTEDDVAGWIAEGGDNVDPYFICPRR